MKVRRAQYTRYVRIFISYWFFFDAGYYALLISALRRRLRAVSIWLSSNRNGSAPKKRVINHFKRTVIYHHRNDSHSTCFVVCLLFSSASCSLSFIIRMTTCREPKVCLEGATFSRKVNHTLSKRQSYIIPKRKFWSCILLWNKVSTWLNLFTLYARFIDFPCVFSLIQECKNKSIICWRYAEC